MIITYEPRSDDWDNKQILFRPSPRDVAAANLSYIYSCYAGIFGKDLSVFYQKTRKQENTYRPSGTLSRDREPSTVPNATPFMPASYWRLSARTPKMRLGISQIDAFAELFFYRHVPGRSTSRHL